MQASEKGLLLRVPFYCSFQGTVLLGVHFFFFFFWGGGGILKFLSGFLTWRFMGSYKYYILYSYPSYEPYL